ncbi:MAG: hypothetical protein KTR32_27425, partial [Granulosicoccus sp.]|nr:hypothetical protein [Granulosicoccus sp.]
MADKQPSTFYRCLSVILTPVMLIHAISRSMKDGGWRYLKQRCAVYSTAEDETPSYRWIHAASVGEVNTVMPLIKELQQRVPKLNVLVTTTTPTGAEVLSKASGGSIKIKHCYLPIDTKAACTRFLRQYDVCSLWVVETEIWPWLYSCCHQQQIPVTIINARLSRRTTKHARRWSGKVLGHAIKNVDILARSSIDAERYMQLGAAPGRTRTIGNLKHARRAEPDQVTRLSNRTYVVAASTHHDEEIQLAKRWSELPDSQQPPRLLIVIPRHPERGPEIQQRLKTLNVPCELRSRQQEPQHEQRVYIADTVG